MGVLDTNVTFENNQVVTSTLMNDIMDQSFFTVDGLSNSTLSITAGKLKVATSGITSNEMGVNAVTTAAIANGSITSPKIDSAGPKWGSTFTFVGQRTSASPYFFTIAADRTANGESHLNFSASTTSNADAYMIRRSGTNGNLDLGNNGTGNIRVLGGGVTQILTTNGLTLGGANMPLPSGVAPLYGIRAWANFNAQSNDDIAGTFSRTGTTITVTATAHALIVGHLVYLDFTAGTGTVAPDGLYVVASVADANTFTVTSAASASGTGTVILRRKTIRASGNIACISAAADSPVIPPTSSYSPVNGYYVANFAVAMPNENYTVLGTCAENAAFTAGAGNDILSGSAYNAQCSRILTISVGTGSVDCLVNSFSIVG